MCALLGGHSWAACEKDILHPRAEGQEILSWNRFPYRDPSERIVRVGQGFSKIQKELKSPTSKDLATSKEKGVLPTQEFPNENIKIDRSMGSLHAGMPPGSRFLQHAGPNYSHGELESERQQPGLLPEITNKPK